jgi:hypothetical protein
MAINTKVQMGRVTNEAYCELPEGHRTTFVVGMCDMLEFASLYCAQEQKERLAVMLGYGGKYESGALRNQFDDYLKADGSSPKRGAAGSFFNALNEWCGFDKGK